MENGCFYNQLCVRYRGKDDSNVIESERKIAEKTPPPTLEGLPLK